ncbi:hydrolase [Rhodococcoides trifolii]|uniref:Hydrolase n=1 Tax=Rhodococcoides trifolii TaxID=908250 RepID=A0A917LEF6_9NOCA|nr:alpha/beta hydrolase [Rhodococcus trifolii]GGG16189.1 hydrolase [Rhodococcus trifolii]
MSTHTATVTGATLTYDVHGDLTPDTVPLVLIGSPMDASGFGTLASHFTDRTVVTYDPRNAGRSVRDDATAPLTPQQHADDLHAVLQALGTGPVDLFGSSGGAVNALALVAAYPNDARLLVAHEPPAGGVLPDREVLSAVCADMVATYDSSGLGPAMAKFIALVMHRGELDSTYLTQPAPDPAMFGLPTEDDGSRTDPLMANMRGNGAGFAPDIDALKSAPTQIVLAVGEESGGPVDGEMAGRGGYAVAALLGAPPVVFPGAHQGFLGGEFGQTGKPTEFAAKLREVLA